MLIEKPHFKIENRLADNAEPEMPRLNDSSVNRSNGNLVNAFAFNLFENIFVWFVCGLVFYFSVFERFEKRMKIRGVILMQKQSAFVESALEFYSESVGDFTFVPACRRKSFSDGNGLVAA